MAEKAFSVTPCQTVARLTPPGLDYGFDGVASRFSVIVPRTGRWVGVADFECGEPAGVDVETFPGGGEPSAVKSDFCSASVLATGAGMITGLFMSRAFTLKRNVICSAARERRLSLSAHGLGHSGHNQPPSLCGGASRRTRFQSHASEQP